MTWDRFKTVLNNELWFVGFFLSLITFFHTIDRMLRKPAFNLLISNDFYYSNLTRVHILNISLLLFCFSIAFILGSILYAKNIKNDSSTVKSIPIIITFILIKYMIFYPCLKFNPALIPEYRNIFLSAFGLMASPFIAATVFRKNSFSFITSINILLFLISLFFIDTIVYFLIASVNNDISFSIADIANMGMTFYSIFLATVITISFNQWLYSKIQPWTLRLYQRELVADLMLMIRLIIALVGLAGISLYFYNILTIIPPTS